MRFSVPTNWDNSLLPAVKKNEVDELYGKLAADFIGGGRPSHSLPHISKGVVRKHIQEVHRYGFKFNYLLNSLCLNNKEFTISGQRNLEKILDWLMDMQVDIVTVSIPYLLEWIKKRYPALKVGISSQANINTLHRAHFWEDLGADTLILSYLDVNRDFPLLKAIRRGIKCELVLIANNICLYNCPFHVYHALSDSHFSQHNGCKKSVSIGYCTLSCRYKKAMDIAEFIRSGWIRPEDIHYYEEIGIDKIKLVDRTMPTSKIISIVDAYINRYYEGNLFELFVSKSKENVYRHIGLFWQLQYFFHPLLVNMFKYIKIKNIFKPMDIFIDNRGLDDFLEYFTNHSCSSLSCRECGYCEQIAKRTVKFIPSSREKILNEEKKFFDKLISSEMFRY